MNVEDLIEKAQAALSEMGGLWSVHPDDSANGKIISVRKLRDFIEDKTGRRAIVKIAPSVPECSGDAHLRSDTHIFGQVFVYEKSAEIHIPRMNRCWHRFAIAKELAHVWFPDRTGAASTALTLSDLAKMAASYNVHKPTDEIPTEAMGIYLALEILMPWEIRGELHDLYERARVSSYKITPDLSQVQVVAGENALRKIALKYLIPVQFVEHYFIDEEYLKISAEVHNRRGDKLR